MDAVSTALRRVPVRRRYLLADAVAAGWWRVASADWRRVVRSNYACVLRTEPDDPRTEQLARRSVRNYSRMAVDFLVVRTLDDTAVLAWAKPAGEEYLEAAFRTGKGAILALPHVGSWDVAAAFASAAGWHLNIVTEDNWGTQLAAGSRVAHGVSLVPRTGSLRPLFAALARNEAIVLLSDMAPAGVQTVEVSFFGHPIAAPIGPARLALRAGAPILVAASVRLPDGSYRVEAQPPLRPDPALPRAAAVADLTARIVAGFERIVAAYPDQWYPFHDIWRRHTGAEALAPEPRSLARP
jgi:KDO2-lipid IV(A) lauroyltransferase